MADKDLIKRLTEVENKFNSLTEQLADPEVLSNQNKVREISKERAALEDMVEFFNKYKELKKLISDNKELIKTEKDKELIELARTEIDEAVIEQNELEKKLQRLLLPKDPNDDKNILLEIRAGTGGDESALFSANLFRMYSKYAEKNNWKIEIMSSSPTGLGGYKEVIAMIRGESVYSKLKYESGVHRVQRVPETETQGRVHTSACTVAVLPEAEEIDIEINPQDLKIDVYRSSGPGGQSVNTTDSAVRITHIPSGIVVAMQDEKSQHKNKDKALKILKTRLFDLEQRKQQQERAAERKNMVGTGDRSERIRTYNFPQGRLTDHRIGLTLYKLTDIMEGNLDEVILSLVSFNEAEALKASN